MSQNLENPLAQPSEAPSISAPKGNEDGMAVNNPARARHICRKCGQATGTAAHRQWFVHVKQVHGHCFVPAVCSYDHCGGQASPYEGRYTETYRPKGEMRTE